MHTNRKIWPHKKHLALQSITVFVIIFFVSRPYLTTFFESNSQAIRFQTTINLFLTGLALVTLSLILSYFKFFKKINKYEYPKTLILALGGGGGGLIGVALLLFIIRNAYLSF